MHIRKNDLVQVIAGKGRKDKEQGVVLKVYPKTDKILVEGVNFVTKHEKPSGDNPGGIIEVEAPIHVSNVQVVCPDTKEPTRIRFERKDGKKVRISVKSNKPLDK